MNSSIEISLSLSGAKKRTLERAMNELSFMDDEDDNLSNANPPNLDEAIYQLSYTQLIEIIPIIYRPGNYAAIKQQPMPIQELFIPECIAIINNNELLKNSAAAKEKFLKFISLPRQLSSAPASAIMDIKTKAIECNHVKFEEDIPYVLFDNLDEDICKRISLILGNTAFQHMIELIIAVSEADKLFNNSLILNLILMAGSNNQIEALDEIQKSMSNTELMELLGQIDHEIKNARDFLSVIKVDKADSVSAIDMELGHNLGLDEEQGEEGEEDNKQDEVTISHHSGSDDGTEMESTAFSSPLFLTKKDGSSIPNIDVIQIHSYCMNTKVKKYKMSDEAFRISEKAKYEDPEYCMNIINSLYMAHVEGRLQQQKTAPARGLNLQFEREEKTNLKHMYISGLSPFNMRYQGRANGHIRDILQIAKKTGARLSPLVIESLQNLTSVMNIQTTAEGEEVTSTVVLDVVPFTSAETKFIITCEARSGGKIKTANNKWEYEFGNQTQRVANTYAVNFTQHRQEDMSIIAVARGIQNSEINCVAEQLQQHLDNIEGIPQCSVMAYVCRVPYQNLQNQQERLLVNHLIILTKRVKDLQDIKSIRTALHMNSRSTILFLGHRNVELLESIRKGYNYPLPQAVKKNGPCLMINNISYIHLEELLEAVEPIVQISDILSIHYYRQIGNPACSPPYVYVLELKENTVHSTSPPIELLRLYATEHADYKFTVKYSTMIVSKSSKNSLSDIFGIESSMLWKPAATSTLNKRTGEKAIASYKYRK